jgi:hypothetical protein
LRLIPSTLANYRVLLYDVELVLPRNRKRRLHALIYPSAWNGDSRKMR